MTEPTGQEDLRTDDRSSTEDGSEEQPGTPEGRRVVERSGRPRSNLQYAA